MHYYNDNFIAEFEHNINQVYRFISTSSKYQIDHLDSKAKDTLLKIEKLLSSDPKSKIEYMPLPENELEHLSQEISLAKKNEYKNTSPIRRIGLFFRNLFTKNRKIIKFAEKIKRKNFLFIENRKSTPNSNILKSWERILKETKNVDVGDKELSIENKIIQYLSDENPEYNKKDEIINGIINISRMNIPESKLKDTIIRVSNKIVDFSQKEMSKAGGSQAPRTAARTPNEVLINLLAFIRKHPAEFIEYETKLKEIFMKHEIELETLDRIFNSIISSSLINQEEKAYLENLKKQLPSNLASLPLTRKHENIYGRVFETALINHLVENPPDEVIKSINSTSKQLALLLRNTFLNDNGKVNGEYRSILYRFRNFIKKDDVRFWFPKVEGLTKIGELDNYSKIFDSLVNYLEEDKNTGLQCISVPYTLVKIIVLIEQFQRRNNKSIIPWMDRTNKNYKLIVSQTSRIKRAKELYTEGAGITLPHQPSAQHEDWMIPSQRPSTFYQLQIDKPSKSARLALERGVPWGGGVSGSTNVALFALHNFNKEYQSNIDPMNYLLGTIMFLTYDGGHSIHEALWTGNQLDNQLHMGLNLSEESTDPKEFVADYTKLLNILKGDAAKKFEEGVNEAFDKVIKYYNDYSYFKVK